MMHGACYIGFVQKRVYRGLLSNCCVMALYCYCRLVVLNVCHMAPPRGQHQVCKWAQENDTMINSVW